MKMNQDLMVFILEIIYRKNLLYIINLDECSNIGTHWVPLLVNNNNVTYSDSFRVEHIPKEI